MIPRTLANWSVDAVLDLLIREMFESDRFDYKERLPHSRDESGKDRLRRACCAFANGSGGFIVFGISDDRRLPPANRLIGLDADLDFPQQFGNYPKNCAPSVEWDFRNPPLSLGNGKVVHVVEIPRSWKAPHATGDREQGWRFTKRTNQGDEGMTIEEVQSAFLGLYEKRLKLQLLRAELTALKEIAVHSVAEEEQDRSYSLVTYEMQVIQSVLADTYSIMATDTQLLGTLSELRQVASVANNKTRIFFNVAHLPMTGKPELIREHNVFMRAKSEAVAKLCDEAIRGLDRVLGH